jgi:hypothetical protein
MNTWSFEKFGRQYNGIKSLMEKVCILLVLVTYKCSVTYRINFGEKLMAIKIFYCSKQPDDMLHICMCQDCHFTPV